MKEPLTYVVGSFLKEGGQKMALTFQEHWIYSGSYFKITENCN